MGGSAADLCSAIFADVQSLALTVEGLTVLREEGRKLCRFLKRTEVLISDVAPYLPHDGECPPEVWVPLKEVYDTLHEDIYRLLLSIAAKGPLATYLEAEPLLKRFRLATRRLHDAIGRLPLTEMMVPEETCDEMEVVMALLAKARFDLLSDHRNILERYHTACDGVTEHAATMVSSAAEIVQAISGAPAFTREGFAAATNDLFKEVDLLNTTPDSSENIDMVRYLRMFLEAMRLKHVSSEVPVEYLCPLTYQLMEDPVVLVETGHSYERSAIEGWVAKGNRFCPRTGTKLGWGKLNLAPNLALKEAIRRWHGHGNLSLNFQPLLQTVQDCSKAPDKQTMTPAMPPVGVANANVPADQCIAARATSNAGSRQPTAAPSSAASSVAPSLVGAHQGDEAVQDTRDGSEDPVVDTPGIATPDQQSQPEPETQEVEQSRDVNELNEAFESTVAGTHETHGEVDTNIHTASYCADDGYREGHGKVLASVHAIEDAGATQRGDEGPLLSGEESPPCSPGNDVAFPLAT